MRKSTVEYSVYQGEKLARQRARYAARREKRRRRSARRAALQQSRFRRRSEVIGMLAACARRALPVRKNNELRVVVPKHFSIIDDPDLVLDTLTAFAAGLDGQNIQKVVFDHRYLEKYDLAANALLDIVAVERNVEIKWRQRKRQLRVAGVYPLDESVKRFIKAMGIIKHMEIAHEALSKDEAKTLRIFDARNRNYYSPADGSKADYKDLQQRKFVDHIDACLRDHKWELTDLGKHQLLTYLGEILANAEDHAGYLDWSVQGYLDNSLDVPMCEIAIFNFGRSIAESMRTAEGEYTWRQVKPYLDMHARKRLFGTSWNEDDLLTVVALQGNVSRLNRDERDTRGQGTVELIDFFQTIHDVCNVSGSDARMAIISGSTYVLFDGTHRMATRPGAGKIIAFNDTNDLNERPDTKYVKSLGPLRFPGTIISIKFPLSLADSTLVEEVSQHGNGNDN